MLASGMQCDSGQALATKGACHVPGSIPFQSAAGPSSRAIVATVPSSPLHAARRVSRGRMGTIYLPLIALVLVAFLLQLQPHFGRVQGQRGGLQMGDR